MSKNNFNGPYPAFFSTTPLKIMITIKVKKQNKKTRLVVLKAAAFYRQNEAGSHTVFHKRETSNSYSHTLLRSYSGLNYSLISEVLVTL